MPTSRSTDRDHWNASSSSRNTCCRSSRSDLLLQAPPKCRVDRLALRWDQVSGNIISVAQEKTRKRLAIPLHEGLHQILAEVPRTAVTILTNTQGAPWTKDGFKTSWQKAFLERSSSASSVASNPCPHYANFRPCRRWTGTCTLRAITRHGDCSFNDTTMSRRQAFSGEHWSQGMS